MFSSVSISSDDSYVDVVFDEGVYDTNGGSGALEPADFLISVSTGYGEVTSASVSSIKALDGTNPVGGETTLRLYISLTGTKRGVETLTFYPVNGSSIYDASGNAMYQNLASDPVTLGGAYEYYVDPLGTDETSSHGTSSGANAWATIQYAVNSVSNPTYVPIIIHISGDTYTLNNDDISIARNFVDLTLRGDKASTTIIQAHSDPASASSRNFYVDYSENVTFEDMTIRYGNGGYSGGIESDASGLTIRRCYIYDNNQSSSGGGGGLRDTRANLLIEDTTFASNTGSYISGAYVGGEEIVIKNSTFYNNTGSTYGTVYIGSPNQDVYVLNSIFAKGQQFLMQGSQDTYIRNSIFIDNIGMDIEYYNYFGTVYPENTIIGYEDTDGAAPYITNGVNGNMVYNTNTTLADLSISDTLAMNGSVNGVKTLALETGSPAINGGEAATVGGHSTPSLDQRGASRVAGMDIGPYEYGGIIGAPYVIQFYPTDNSTNIAVNSGLALYFSEIVDAEAGADNDIIIKKASDNSIVEIIDAQDAKVSGSGTSVISINPATTFDEKTEYYVLVGSDAFDDVNSNSFDGVSTSTWSFTTIDNTAPLVSYFLPTDNATSVNENATFEIAFNEAVAVGSGNIKIYKTSDDSLVETIDIAGALVTASGTTALIINPSTTLNSNTEYYFIIDSTAIDDIAGNSYSGISASSTWSFTTGDTIAPITLSLSPADNATNVDVDATFEITFNEAIATSSGNIRIFKTSDDSLVETIDIAGALVTASGTTALIIDPSTTLASETEYYFMIDLTAIDDLNGNSFLGITASTTWSFTTSDILDPTVSTLSPADNSTNIATSTNLVITFNEVVATSSGSILIYKADDDSLIETIDSTGAQVTGNSTSTITINPSVSLEEETEYYVIIEATVFDDLSGNSFAGITASSTWSFTTGDFTDPVLSTLSPADNSTNIATSTNLVITFNEVVATSSGSILIYKADDDSLIETIDSTGAQVTGNSTSTITINPSVSLEEETEYYVIIEATVFDDLSGNSFAGITASSTWSFTTGDFTDPDISVLSPLDNASGVLISSDLVITFNENIATSSGNIKIYKTSDDSLVETIDVTSSQVGTNGTDQITVNPASDLSYETGYYIVIEATAFDDLSGNSFAGIALSSVWNFTTEDIPSCPAVANAATYNSYPGCGVATCNSGYTLSGGVCIASGGGSSLPSAPAIGDGVVDASIPMNKFKDIGEVTSRGINSMMYINSEALFSVKVSYTKKKETHKIRIVDLDISKNIVKLIIESEPKELTLSLTDKKRVDLDNDGIDDMEITFADLLINRVELTIKELAEENKIENLLDLQDKIFEIKNDNLYSRLKGKILLRVEAKGEAYYVNPDDNKMHYLGRPADAFQVMRELGLGISEKDFNSFTIYASNRLAGKILLRVEARGEAYYVNPTDLKMHYLGRPADAFNIMRTLGLGISEENFGDL